jgi:hypothetical protein
VIEQGNHQITRGYRHPQEARVETIPSAWVDAIRPQVEAGRRFKETAAEFLLINAELLVLDRKQRPHSSRPPAPPPP